MPDILIRGMEMPGSCAACDFYNVISGRCTRTGTKINFSELTTRSVDCPISELPPHGDLIDRDNLEPDLAIWNGECGDPAFSTEAIDNAPVVVPAEKVVE